MATSDGGNKSGLVGKLFGLMFVLGISAFWLSILGLILTCFSWVVLTILKNFTYKSGT